MLFQVFPGCTEPQEVIEEGRFQEVGQGMGDYAYAPGSPVVISGTAVPSTFLAGRNMWA